MPIRFPDEAFSGGNGAEKYLRINKIKDMPGRQVRIRILSEPIVGREAWDENNKPWRGVDDIDLNAKMAEAGAKIRVEKDKKNPKDFAAMWVRNITTGTTQVISIVQKTIWESIKSYANDDEWGDVSEYDFIISQSEEGGKVSYTVKPCKPTKLDDAALAVWARISEECVGLDALFHNGNPFDLWSSK